MRLLAVYVNNRNNLFCCAGESNPSVATVNNAFTDIVVPGHSTIILDAALLVALVQNVVNRFKCLSQVVTSGFAIGWTWIHYSDWLFSSAINNVLSHVLGAPASVSLSISATKTVITRYTCRIPMIMTEVHLLLLSACQYYCYHTA